MKRQLNQGNHNADLEGASSQHFSAGLSQQDISGNLRISRKDVEPPGSLISKIVNEPRQYSPSERKLRANEFASRVRSLKFYIGLIGANAII